MITEDDFRYLWEIVRYEWEYFCEYFGFEPDRRIYRVPDDIC